MATPKMTKANVLNAIKEIVAEDTTIQVGDVSVTGTDIITYCDTTLAQIAAKAEKAAEKAAEKKTEGDALRAEILTHITDEFQTADAITASIEGFGDVTKSKVVARLSQLIKNGDVVKEQVKVGDTKAMAYKLA